MKPSDAQRKTITKFQMWSRRILVGAPSAFTCLLHSDDHDKWLIDNGRIMLIFHNDGDVEAVDCGSGHLVKISEKDNIDRVLLKCLLYSVQRHYIETFIA